MLFSDHEWHPGSFTKNFSWGPPNFGLKILHEAINIGFDGQLADTPRALFRERMRRFGRPDFIPINFFLLNRIIDGEDHLVVDELIFNALEFPHSNHFDKLALFALFFSYVGKWKAARLYQSYPSLWARYYVLDRIKSDFSWKTDSVSADDVEKFLKNSTKYTGQTTRKLSTNFFYIMNNGNISEFFRPGVDRWWVDCAFLALDRYIEFRRNQQKKLEIERVSEYLIVSEFNELSGPRSLEKDLSVKHLTNLYSACGGPDRFSPEAVKDLQEIKFPDLNFAIPNNNDALIAIHPTNPSIAKSVPRICAMLAKYAGFLTINLDEFDRFSIDDFVIDQLNRAKKLIKEQGIKPDISAEDLIKMLRGEN